MAKDKQFKIPEQILSSLNEMSSGGYILFTFDQFGDPIINSQFDGQHQAAAMFCHIKQWCQALEHINLQATINNILINSKSKKKN